VRDDAQLAFDLPPYEHDAHIIRLLQTGPTDAEKAAAGLLTAISELREQAHGLIKKLNSVRLASRHLGLATGGGCPLCGLKPPPDHFLESVVQGLNLVERDLDRQIAAIRGEIETLSTALGEAVRPDYSA
jgi:DNA repair exonuclease SbcCD ATPase subunit